MRPFWVFLPDLRILATAEFLLHEGTSPSMEKAKFYAEWGIDTGLGGRDGLKPAHIEKGQRKVYLLQRKSSKLGDGLGKTKGWIHRASLKNREVEMIGGVTYRKVDDAGLHITVGEKEITLPVDSVVLCAGQEPQRALQAQLQAAGCRAHLIGGADVANELDAMQRSSKAPNWRWRSVRLKGQSRSRVN